MRPVAADIATITPEYVTRLSDRAAEAERLRRLPSATLADPITSEFIQTLVPARYGGWQEPFPAILSPVRRMAHGWCLERVDARLLRAAQLDARPVQ